MKGEATIIVSMILLAIAVAMSAGFYFWLGGSADELKDAAKEKVEDDIGREESRIEIPVVVVEDKTRIVVHNVGRITLDTNKFVVFIDGSLVTGIPETEDALQPGDSVIIEVDDILTACAEHTVRVTGEHSTSADYKYHNTFGC